MANISFISCKKATELTEKKLSFGLSITEEIRLRVHHNICKYCAQYHKQSIIIDVFLKNHIEHPETVSPVSGKIAEETAKNIIQKISV